MLLFLKKRKYQEPNNLRCNDLSSLRTNLKSNRKKSKLKKNKGILLFVIECIIFFKSIHCTDDYNIRLKTTVLLTIIIIAHSLYFSLN